MSWFSALVLYAVIWFLTLFVVLPLRLVTQGDAGTVVPGTPAGAPVDAQMKRRLWITTAAATVVWAIVTGTILSGALTVADLEGLYRR
jgi:predicted secreted protein